MPVKSYNLPDDVTAELDAADNASARLTGIVRRYLWLVRASLPKLTRNQWRAIADANNGTDEDPSSTDAGRIPPGTLLWAKVADSVGLDDKWGIDQGELVRLMRAWTPAEHAAAWEACRTFWRNHERPTDEALRLAGMIED